jgi:two-component system LytT family response regulator
LVLLTSESFANAFVWSASHYAHWLVLTPALLWLLSKLEPPATPRPYRAISAYLGVIVLALLVAVSCRVVMLSFAPLSQPLLAMLITALPQQMVVLTMILLIWQLLMFISQPKAHRLLEDNPASVPAREQPCLPSIEHTVLVTKGQGECLIQWSQVDCISAAGNYVELMVQQETYLLRATMKQIAQRLPATDFIRIHRCHIVNLQAIAQIIGLPAGNANVNLRCGRVLPLSKSYKSQLKTYKLNTQP